VSEKRVALITGGSRGIGLGIAMSLAQEGWDLAINGMRDSSQVDPGLDPLRALGRDVCYCRGDVGQTDDRANMVQQVREHFGQLNLLVNNAGITSPGRKDILDATEDTYDRVMAVNLKGAYFLTQLAARWMIEQHQSSDSFRGYVINIGSVSGELVSLNRGDYCMSWAGLSMSTKLWAARLAEHHISVYEIRPGIIRTDMTSGVTEKYDRLIADGLTLQRRWGTPEDVGRVATMMARGDLPYSTGNVVTVDGGLTVERL